MRPDHGTQGSKPTRGRLVRVVPCEVCGHIDEGPLHRLMPALQLARFALADTMVDADGQWTFVSGPPDQLTRAIARYRLGRYKARDMVVCNKGTSPVLRL
jgi:hypothetical protein